MKMDEKTLKATHKGVEKWVKIERSTRSWDRKYKNCALCTLFADNGCKHPVHGDCPIKRKVGTWGCRKTPYVVWEQHQRKAHGMYTYDPSRRTPGCEECLILSGKMKSFLISLLPLKEREVWNVQ